jgi:hypothetical protein
LVINIENGFLSNINLLFVWLIGIYVENHIECYDNKELSIMGESRTGVVVICDFSYGKVFIASGSASLSIKLMTIISGCRKQESVIEFLSSGYLVLDDVIISQNLGFFFIYT